MKRSKSAAAVTVHASLKSAVLLDASVVPRVPEGYKPLAAPVRLGALKVYADQRAETDQAMHQIWENRAQLAKDLGLLAPDTGAAKELLDRMVAARELNRKAQAFAAYADDQEALANHAVMTYLNEVVADIEHVASKNPQVAERYPAALTVIAQRRDAIVAGIARSKAAKSAEPPTA